MTGRTASLVDQRIAELREQRDTTGSFTVPLQYETLRQAARDTLSEEAKGFVLFGAGRSDTLAENEAAFDRWRIVPRMLRDVSDRDLGVDLLGSPIPYPILLAPVGHQSVFVEGGETEAAKAAAALGVPFVLSSAASASIETVAEAMGAAPRWFQLYLSRERELSRSFVERAEAAGYGAIVITVDQPRLGWRPEEIERGSPFDVDSIANYTTDPVFQRHLEERDQDAMDYFQDIAVDPSITWDDIRTVRRWTDLPLVIKGILDPDDADMAVEAGADGIIVSNHGGNHLTGAIASLEALPTVAERIDGRISVLFDSGIRTGSDVFRAIALGADAVLIGRPYLYGLALTGTEGVSEVLKNLLAEFDATMALSGAATIEAVRAARIERCS